MAFLTELFVFLMAALVVVPVLNRLGLSSVIGYLLAGIIIGPSGLPSSVTPRRFCTSRKSALCCSCLSLA